MFQVNPANGKEARCALTAKGLRYWEFIPQVFDYDADQSYFECPFAGAWFQWMRNLTGCYAAARASGRAAAFVLAYADGPGLRMAARVRGPEWARLQNRLQPGAVTLRAWSYQALVRAAQTAAPEDPVWPALARWVDEKIAAVGSGRGL